MAYASGDIFCFHLQGDVAPTLCLWTLCHRDHGVVVTMRAAIRWSRAESVPQIVPSPRLKRRVLEVLTRIALV